MSFFDLAAISLVVGSGAFFYMMARRYRRQDEIERRGGVEERSDEDPGPAGMKPTGSDSTEKKVSE